MPAQPSSLGEMPEVDEIIKALFSLPPEKAMEVRDDVLLLQARYGQLSVDEQDFWSEEDVQDLGIATLTYATQAGAVEESGDV